MQEHIRHKDKLERNRGLILQFSIILSLLIILMLFENKTRSAEITPKTYTQIEFEIEANNTILNPTPPVPGDSLNYTKPITIKSLASFSGGEKSLKSYFAENMNYSEEAVKKDIQGRVIVRFTVDTTGKVKNPEVIRSIHPILDTEAIRLVKNMPDWKPETINGKPVISTQTTNVIFINKQ
jgi:TonB family protein